MSRMKGKWRHAAAQLSLTERDVIDDPNAICVTEGKRRYPNEVAAQRAAAHQMSVGSPPLQVYQCSYCDSWHLTRG